MPTRATVVRVVEGVAFAAIFAVHVAIRESRIALGHPALACHTPAGCIARRTCSTTGATMAE